MSTSRSIKKIHSSAVPSREFHKILLTFSQLYGVYPSFRVITPTKPFISEWGEITLPRVPKEDYLHPDEKYFLLISTGYHSIAPRTEINRLILRSIVSKLFNLDWKSSTVSWLSGLFSTLQIYTSLRKNTKLRNIMRDPLKWIIATLETNKQRSPLIDFVKEYYRYLLERKVLIEDLSEYVKAVEEILSSNIPFENKIKAFFNIIRALVKEEMYDDRKMKQNLSNITLSLGAPFGEERKNTWGQNWRVLRDKKIGHLSPQEIAKLAKIDEKSALEIAKELDKKMDNQGEKRRTEKHGFLPGYSERLRMFQKLLSQRRYIAAVRRVRIEEILAAIRDRPYGARHLAIRGQTTWEIGDDEEELNIETSIETFGKLIPNLTTLRDLYEEDTEGRKKRGISHLEIVIDTSGSMNGAPLETAIDIAVALVEMARRFEDSIALVTFSSGAWEGIPPSFEYDAMEDIILRLMADGGTNLRGAISIINDHLSQINDLASIIIISDTAIWDINRLEVKDRIREWALKMPVYLIAIADEMYEETQFALRNSLVRLIRISPSQEKTWEIVLDLYETM